MNTCITVFFESKVSSSVGDCTIVVKNEAPRPKVQNMLATVKFSIKGWWELLLS